MAQITPYVTRSADPQKDEKPGFKIRQIFSALASLPRVLKLVWSANAPLTLTLGLLGLIQGVVPALTIWITKQVIDSVVQSLTTKIFTMVIFWVAIQMAINLLDRLLTALSNITQQLLQEKMSMKVQLMILEKAATLDLSFFEDSEFYDKMRQATDQANYRPVSMISQFFGLGETIITFVSMMAILLQLEWWLAIVALIVTIPGFFANARYGWMGYHRMRRQSPERRQMMYYIDLMTRDNYNKEIKLFNLSDFFIQQYRRLSTKFYEENKAIVVKRYLINFLWLAVSVIANSAIYLFIALQAVAGRITLGGLTYYTQSAVQVGQNFKSILDGFSSTYENNLFISTLFEFLEYQPKIVAPPQAPSIVGDPQEKGIAVEFRDVSFTYPGKDPETQAALKNVNFTIQPGQSIALVGRNGAGKTTIVKLLTRLYDPDEGEILVNGRNIKEYNLDELRAQVGVIFQDYGTYFMSAAENIGIGQIDKISNQEQIAVAAQKSGANAVIEKLPATYDTMLGKWFKDGTQLSGGEWQKIALARAFMREARVLILDEPSSALDAQAEYDLFSQFRTLTEGKSAIFISHRFSTVRLADHIYVIENGRIVESGSHRELLTLDGRYAHLFNLQAEAYR